MRRTDREITDTNEKLEIIDICKVCRLGLSENNQPYIVPLNYGYSYENNSLTLYFHSANTGKKRDIIKNNNKACFEIDCDTALIEGEKACNYGYAYKSIIGSGEIIILELKNEKINGLNILMKHQTGKDIEHNFEDAMLNNVTVYKMIVKEFTGKKREIPART